MLSASPDAAFPYRVCGVERRRGAVCVSSLGTDASGVVIAAIAALGGTVRPDPSDLDVLYGGDLARYDRRLEQVIPVTPAVDGAAANNPGGPVLFGPDNKTLYYASKIVWRTTTSGQSWTATSPDLTSGRPEDAISALTFSPLSPRLLWAGTRDGIVQLSRDAGMTWTRREPAVPGERTTVFSLEGSHFDLNSAYLTIGRVDPAQPSAYRTRDAGETWKALLTDMAVGRVYAIREDTFRRGLLFAGTDAGLFVSFDDGETWSSLQLDLPGAPIRDLFIRDADLVVATAGKGLWMLPDVSPLRQATSDVMQAGLFLFRPGTAWRLRARESDATAGGPREPEGVAFYYTVGPQPPASLTLEVIATVTGEVLRRFTSDAPASSEDWLDNSPGLHRRVWNLRYSSPGSIAGERPGEQVPLTALRVPANAYQVRLASGSRVLRQAVNIRMDPRVRAAASDLAAGFTLAKAIDDKIRQVVHTRSTTGAGASARMTAIDGALGDLVAVARSLQRFDGRPTPAIDAAAASAMARADNVITSAE